MVKKVQSVISITLFIICVTYHAFGQLSMDDVGKDVSKYLTRNIQYPKSFRANCNPIFTNILITVSSLGVIDSVYISDNAPVDLKTTFNLYKLSFNFKSLQKYIRNKKLSNCGILFPIVYFFNEDNCKIKFDLKEFKPEKYYSYKGARTELPTFNFDPIIVTLYPSIR